MNDVTNSLRNVWAVARWESTMVRRTVRYWVFGLIAILTALGLANIHSAQNFFMTRGLAVSGTIALINPKFLFGAYTTFLASSIALLTTFLAFDFRLKERRARLDLVLNARPIRTGELVLGKVLGVFIPVYAMVLVALFAVVASNAIWGFGNLWGAVAAYAFLQFPVAILELIAITAVIGLLVRSRAITAILTIALVLALTLNLFGIFGMKLVWASLFDVFGVSGMPFPSVMMGMTPLNLAVFHRAGCLAVSLGLLGLATLLYPRPRDVAFPRSALATTGLGFLAGGLLINVPVLDALSIVRLNKEVLDEQRLLIDAPRIAVNHYDLHVKLNMSGGRLDGVAKMAIRNVESKRARRLVLTLNRGLTVKSVSGPEGRQIPFERGLSTIVVTPENALAPDAQIEVTIEYGGEFDINDGFLDAPLYLLEMDGGEAQIALLGFQNAYLAGRGAVLLPETRWYPSPNVDYGYGAQGRPANFATARLSIDVQEGMVPVTQGIQGKTTVKDGRATTVFVCQTAVPSFSLNVAPFQVLEGRVGELPVAVYYISAHEKNIRYFEDTASKIREELTALLERAKEEAGLGYPFERLALVECPLGLRGYGGGWEMPSPLTQPGVLMIKENQFFEIQFESVFKWRVDRMKRRGEDVEPIELKWELLDELFHYDYSGGNLLDLLAAQFWRHRIRADGALAAVLDRTLSAEASRLATGRQSYFNAYLYSGDEFQQGIGNLAQRAARQAGGQAPFDFTDTLIAALTDAEDVWQLIESQPLAELEPGEEPGDYLLAIDLKAGAFVRSLRELLGARVFADLLAEMSRRYSFGTYNVDDLRAIASQIHGNDLHEFFAMWLRSTRLPGFRIVSSEAYRVKTESGLPRYQARLRLQNGEDVPGFAKVSLLVDKEEAGARRWDSVDRFVSFGGRQEQEVNLLVSRKPQRFVVRPYLSLNRSDISKDLETSEEERDVDPIEGIQDVEFTGDAPGVTVIDDMDGGFRVEGGTGRGALRVSGRRDSMEEGVIPACKPATPSPTWCRQGLDRAYGRYRHVLTVRPPGRGDGRAIWAGEVEGGGSCQVDVHVPVLAQPFAWNAMGFRQRPDGRLEYAVHHADGIETVRLSVDGLTNGWNGLGRFRFDAGQSYEVRLSDGSDGLVLADAVRWTCRP